MSSQNLSCTRGSGLLGSIGNAAGAVLNRAIDILPVELHLPGYQYCGPGTHLKKRLARNDPGINQLDSACKQHDIAYAKFGDSKSRSIADHVLAEKAWERVKASDSSVAEKAAAWAITNIMKTKAKFGGGNKKKTKTKQKRIKKKTQVLKKQSSTKCKCKKTIKKCKKGKGLYLKPYTGSGNKKKKQCTRQK